MGQKVTFFKSSFFFSSEIVGGGGGAPPIPFASVANIGKPNEGRGHDGAGAHVSLPKVNIPHWHAQSLFLLQ
jgi:hypothetical protein